MSNETKPDLQAQVIALAVDVFGGKKEEFRLDEWGRDGLAVRLRREFMVGTIHARTLAWPDSLEQLRDALLKEKGNG